MGRSQDFGWIFPDAPFQKSVVGRLENPDSGVQQLRCGFDADLGNWHNRLVDYCPDEYELVYVLQGRATCRDETGNEYLVESGDLVQRFPRHTSHLCYTPANQRVITCYIVAPSSIHDVLSSTAALASERPVMHHGYDPSIIEAIRSTYFRLSKALPHEMPAVAGEVYMLLTQIHQRIQQRRYGSDRELSLVDTACELLSSGLDRKVKLRDTAARLGISYRQLRQLFARHLEMAPGVYRIHRRIDRAKDMLSSGSPQKEVAVALGYTDVYAFSKQFKRFTGQTPGEFQRLHVG